jgi:DNA topoisomerase-1
MSRRRPTSRRTEPAGSPSARSRSRPSGRHSPHPGRINVDLVDAQQTRRIVDRLVGYTLSPLISRKVRGPFGRPGPVGGRSPRGGARTRDPGVRGPRVLDHRSDAPGAGRHAVHRGARADRGPQAGDRGRGDGRRHAEALRASRPVVGGVTVKTSKRSPAPPFTTSTLQQEASRKLGFSPKRTMSVAQRLYEGVETPDGQVGLITYMRTDSVVLSGQALVEARAVIDARYGRPTSSPRVAATGPRPGTRRRPTRRSGRRRSRATRRR